jgi:hypothetical protein
MVSFSPSRITFSVVLFIVFFTSICHVNAFLPSSKNVYQPTKKFLSNKQRIPKNVVQERSIKTQSMSMVTKGGAIDTPLDMPRIAITVSCTFLTWFTQRQYTNVMASSALTLICCMCFDKRLGQAAFCGTFAGMASKTIVPTWQCALGLGALTSSLYEILIDKKNAFLGVGGRLGATAFMASLITATIVGTPTGLSLASLSVDNLQKRTILSMAFWHAVGSVATIILRERSDDTTAKDTVRASAVVGLIGALLLEDKSAALAVYGGSFVGMSAPNRLIHGILPGDGKEVPKTTSANVLISFALAGALGGIVHGASIGLNWFNGGWGGKAGFCGFLGCLIYRGIRTAKKSLVSA